jgi:hypothetical protein
MAPMADGIKDLLTGEAGALRASLIPLAIGAQIR